MKQCGLVVQTMERTAKVRMQRHASCAGCNACKMGSQEKPIELEALNLRQAVPGQMVEVEMEQENVLLAAFLMYVVPLIFLVIGVLAGHYGLGALGINQYRDLLTALIAFLFTALAYLILNQGEKREHFKEKMLPVIVEIVPETEEKS